MFEIALFFGIIIGFIRGGKLKYLSEFDFPFFYLIIAALLIQLSVDLVMKVIPNQTLAYMMLAISYLLMLAGLWLNRSNEFLYIVMIGVLLNFFVIALNGGMPVSFGAAKAMGISAEKFSSGLATDFKHVPMFAATKFKILADIIPTPKFYPLPAIYSVGDIFIAIGIFFFLQSHMKYAPKHSK